VSESRDLVVAYFQVTLGHAHLARVRALDAIPGIRCIGIQFADRELTRSAEANSDSAIRTLALGTYEDLPRRLLVRSALLAAEEISADAAILDCPADAVQFATGRLLQRARVATLVRWASTREDYPRHAWKELAKRPIYGGWDGYLATGARSLAYLLSFGVKPDRAFVCGNPVDGAAFERASPATPTLERPAFLFVGRLIWHKNLLRLLAAFSQYRARGGSFDLRIVGGGEDSYAEQVRILARSTSGVTLLGALQQRELAAEYASASCLVLPSISENWGLVVNEAMHAGLPVVISDRCGCVPELIREGENGFVVSPLDENSIADGLMKTERVGSEKRNAMGQRSRFLVASQSLERWSTGTAKAVEEAARRRLK
jgi:glycosyltransferase involved in cell wall biosynthesis